MPRRFWALALVFAMVGGPAASTVCQATCKSQNMHASTGHAHHHSHSSSSQVVGATMSAAPHSCNPQADGTLAIEQSFQSLAGPAVVAVQSLAFPSITSVASVTRTIGIEQSPPGLLALTTHLRV